MAKKKKLSPEVADALIKDTIADMQQMISAWNNEIELPMLDTYEGLVQFQNLLVRDITKPLFRGSNFSDRDNPKWRKLELEEFKIANTMVKNLLDIVKSRDESDKSGPKNTKSSFVVQVLGDDEFPDSDL